MKARCQGDLVIVEVHSPSRDAQRVDHDGILARGESDGHAHRIVGDARYFRDSANNLSAYALTDLQIAHEEHPSISISKGTTFRWHQQREADWLLEAIRNVSD